MGIAYAKTMVADKTFYLPVIVETEPGKTVECDNCGKKLINLVKYADILCPEIIRRAIKGGWKVCPYSQDEESITIDGTKLIGMSLKSTDLQSDILDSEFFKKQPGPYTINKEYNVCWECLLKTHGVEP